MNISKTEWLRELNDNTYVKLFPSPVHGIGVVAIKDIPKGCRSIFGSDEEEWIRIGFDEVLKLEPAIKDLIEQYCLFDENDYYVPSSGFKKMDLSLYLNHSDEPNLISINDGEFFESTREIKSGEELFLDYGQIVSSEE